MANNPEYKKCIIREWVKQGRIAPKLHPEACITRITWEHAWTYENKRINEIWAILPICAQYHLGHRMNKRLNQEIAMSRASEEDKAKYPKLPWRRRSIYLKQ